MKKYLLDEQKLNQSQSGWHFLSKKLKYLATSGLALALLLSLPGTAFSQEAETDISTLDTVVVSATRTETSLRELSTNVTVITKEDLDRSPHNKVDKILQQAGLVVQSYPGQNTAVVQMRGMQESTFMGPGGFGAKTLILLNGRPAGTANIAMLTKTNIERIEIIRGPSGLMYGSQAMAGVVNLITLEGEGDLSAHFTTGFGSNGFNEQEGGFNVRAGALDISAGLYRNQTSDSFKTAKGWTATGTDTKYFYAGSLNMGFNFLDDRHRIGLITSFADTKEQGIGGSYQGLFDATTEDWLANLQNNNIDQKNQSYDLIYTGSDEDNFLNWMGRYYHLRDKYFNFNSRDRENAPNGGLIFGNEIISDGAQAQVTAKWDIYELTGGIDWRKTEVEGGFSAYDGSEIDNKAAYLAGKVGLLDDTLFFTGGLRYDDFDTTITDRTTNVDNWATTIGVAYHVTDWLKLRANYANGFNLPTPQQLAFDVISGGERTLGNPNLTPESLTSYEFGFDVNTEYLNLDVTYFTSVYENKVVLDESRKLTERITTFKNEDEDVKADGFEFGISANLGSYMGWGAEVTPYLRGTWHTKYETQNPAPATKDTRGVPDKTFTYGVTVDYSDWGLYVNLNANYVGKRQDTLFGTTEFYSQNSGWAYNPSYTTVDLTVEKELVTFADKNKISATFAAYNMFDKYYEATFQYPTPGATVYMGLTYEYN